MQHSSTPSFQSMVQAVAAVALAAGLGLGSGALVAYLAPSVNFSWAGLAVLPLWFLLELFFEAVVAVLGARSRATRIASAIAVLAGFYFAWFALRGFAP